MLQIPIVSVFEALQELWTRRVVAAESMTWSTEKFDSKSEANKP